MQIMIWLLVIYYIKLMKKSFDGASDSAIFVFRRDYFTAT